MFGLFKRTTSNVTSDAPRTLAELVDRYREEKLQDALPRSGAGHVLVVRRLSEHLGREPTIDDLNEVRVRAFCNVRSASGMARATAATEQDRLFALWRFAFEQRWIDRPPGKKPIHIRDRRVRVTPGQPLELDDELDALEFL